MSTTAGEARCFKAKEDLIALAIPDVPKLSINQRFFPRDKILRLLTRDSIVEILDCRCQKCLEDRQYQVLIEAFDVYAGLIVGNERLKRNPADTAVSLFALLIYIGRPIFIVGFLSRNGGANDNTFETGLSGYSATTLQENYWPRYKRLKRDSSAALASEFRWSMNQFAVPHINNGRYHVYNERTILPFVNEKPLGRLSEDGELNNEGSYGKVFAFEIWPEYNNLPNMNNVHRFARKELKGTQPSWFQVEKDNLDKVQRLKDDHIVKIVKAYRHGYTFNIVFPLAKTNLGRYLRDSAYEQDRNHTGLLELNPIWKQFCGITNAIHRIITYEVKDPISGELYHGFHFDLKPENILVQDDLTFVISDFGQATFKKTGGTSSRVVGNGGTDAYAPPEIDNLDTKQSGKYDIWSLGCILVEIATYVVRGSPGLLELDRIKSTKLNNANKEDDRFFEKISDTEGFRIKPVILDWIGSLPLSPHIHAVRSKGFLREVVALALQMLEINVEKRIHSSESVRIMKDLLKKYQTDQIIPSFRNRNFRPEADEFTLGAQKLHDVNNMWYSLNDKWDKAALHIFENQHECLRLVVSGTNFSDTYTGARAAVKLIPRYVWESDSRRGSDSSLYFSPMTSTGQRVFGQFRFFFSDSKEARIVQSILTGQQVYKSIAILDVSYDVCPSIIRKLASLWNNRGKHEGSRIDDSPSVIQLWSEMSYADTAPQSLNADATSNGMIYTRGTGKIAEPMSRRVTIYYREKIIIIPLAKNMKIERPKEGADMLKCIPTDKAKDKYFSASILHPTPLSTDEDPFPGIPLCRKKLRQAEKESVFDCKYFEIKFRRPEDLLAFYKKYMVLKENWLKETRIFEGRPEKKSDIDLESKLPEKIFELLTFEVFLNPDMKDLCEKMLKIKGESLFIRLFKREIRSFCSALYSENLTKIQKGSIRILRRYRAYFAFRVCQLLEPPTIRKVWQLEDLVDQTVEAGVENYLQGLGQVNQSPRDDTAVESISGMGAVKTASQDSRSAEDHAGAENHRIVSVGNKQADDAADDASKFVENESSASNPSDDELDIFSQSQTKNTISWLTRGVSYRNFKHNITKQICSPLQYVHRILQPALSTSELCSATFHVEWQLIQYTNSELEEGDTLVHALTVSGDIIDAEASSCLDYCRRTWPVTGEFVLIALEKATKAGWHEDSSSSGTTISCHLQAGDVSHFKEKAIIVANGSREDVIGVGQQLAWLSVVFRIPNNGKFACSEFIICETPDFNVFNLKLSQLQNIEATPQACWHPLFLNGVLAHGFPIKPRDGEVGVELPFEAMTFFAGIIGPMEYKGGLVLKGFSTIIFPKSPPPLTTNSNQTSVQWHLVYARKSTPIPLELLSEEHSRALLPLTDLKFLAQGRTFLGCYKRVNIHLGTNDTAYDRIGFSQACLPSRKPIFSGFTLGFTMPKFGGPSAAAHFNKPKRQSLTREEHSYEGILSYSSTMPLILYDTSDRRAWMVPALGVILHMIHIWAALQKDSFPTMHFPDLPYANPAWDIGREAQEIIYGNSNLQLYVSKDDNESYMLKDLVKKYWLELEHAIVAGADHKPSADHLIGWDLMELVTRDPFSAAKKPVTREFKGNWSSLANDPNMVVLLCSGLGEVIVPITDTQELCNMWKSVPTEQDYLAASVKCVLQLSKRFPEPNACSKLGPALFWQPSRDIAPFADCLHDRRSPCHRTQELVRTCIRPQAATNLEQQGAIIFGHRRKKLQRRLYQSNLEQ